MLRAILLALLIIVGGPAVVIGNGYLANFFVTLWALTLDGAFFAAFGLWVLFTLAEVVGTWVAVEYRIEQKRRIWVAVEYPTEQKPRQGN